MKKLLLSVVMMVLAGCAYSPQQITVTPRIDTSGEVYGSGQSVMVAAEDARENKTLGSRGGLYKETSVITISNDLSQAITRAVQARLATQGFNVHSPDSNAVLNVVVEELSYDVPEQSTVVKNVVLRCVIRVDAQAAGGQSYTGRYRTTSEQEAMMSPSMKRNEAIVNKVVSDTLMRAFDDPKLKAFLSNI